MKRKKETSLLSLIDQWSYLSLIRYLLTFVFSLPSWCWYFSALIALYKYKVLKSIMTPFKAFTHFSFNTVRWCCIVFRWTKKSRCKCDYCCHLLVTDDGWSTAHFEMNGDRKRQKICGLRCKQVIHHVSGRKACKKGTLSADGCVTCELTWKLCEMYISLYKPFFLTCRFWLHILIHATIHSTTPSEWDLAPRKLTYSVSGATTFITQHS